MRQLFRVQNAFEAPQPLREIVLSHLTDAGSKTQDVEPLGSESHGRSGQQWACPQVGVAPKPECARLPAGGGLQKG